MNTKYSLKQFKETYGTDDQCLEAIKRMRFPDVMECPKCKRNEKFYPVRGRTAYACNYCGHHIFPLVGTIFEKTTTPLSYWFFAIYLMTQTRCGISAKQLERMLGTTYKTAFRMFHLIRGLMEDNPELLTGVIEIDESFFGGAGKNRKYVTHFNEKPKDIIMGFVQRDGKAVMKMITTTG